MALGTIGPRTKLLYGFGTVAYGIKDNGFNFLLLIFYNQLLGLPAQRVGLAIMIALIIDGFSDPLIGHFSDRFHSRLGRRHFFMYISALPCALVYYLLWNPPTGLGASALFWYLLVTAILVRILIALYEVPSAALLAELGADVTAVEPDQAMLAELRRQLPSVRALAGPAEAIPLADGSVDAVLCAQSMHWFDMSRALPEIARVLAPGGALGVIVDAVNGILHVSPGQIAPLPEAANRELGEKIAAIGDRLIVLMDPERVAVAAGIKTPARRTRRRADRGSPESKAAPSDPPR